MMGQKQIILFWQQLQESWQQPILWLAFYILNRSPPLYMLSIEGQTLNIYIHCSNNYVQPPYLLDGLKNILLLHSFQWWLEKKLFDSINGVSSLRKKKVFEIGFVASLIGMEVGGLIQLTCRPICSYRGLNRTFKGGQLLLLLIYMCQRNDISHINISIFKSRAGFVRLPIEPFFFRSFSLKMIIYLFF